MHHTKRFGLSLALLLVFTMLLSSTALAQGGNVPGSGWWSGTQIQNVSDSKATVTVTLYDKDGSDTFSKGEEIDPGAAVTLLPTDFNNLPPGFQGSAVVSANQPVKALVNVLNRPSGSLGIAGGEAAGSYQGIDSSNVADTLYFPLAKGDHYGLSTTYYIQNAGTAPVTPKATFRMRNNDVHEVTMPTIGANKMAIVSLFDAPSFQNVNNSQPQSFPGRVGGLIVEGGTDAKLAGVVLEHRTTENPATVLLATKGFTASDFDDVVYAPVIKNERFERFTGIQVQNVGNSPIDIEVKYRGTAGACANQEYTDSATGVAPDASQTFVQNNQSNLPANCTATATIVAGGDVVAIVNEQNTENPATYGKAGVVYSAFPETSTTSKVSIPLFKDVRFDKLAGLQIQNVGNAATNSLVVEFICRGGSEFVAKTKSLNVPAGGAKLFYNPSSSSINANDFEANNPFASDNVVCSATAQTNDQPIVAIMNETPVSGSSLVMDANNLEGFNLTP